MRLVGLTGGIASGKSTFARALRDLGVPVIDADQVARDIVAKGTVALDAIVQAFGAKVLHDDGTLDRKTLGAIVFSDPEARLRLEAITHPAVRARVMEESQRLVAAGHELAFYDVPLLFEVGLDRELDSVVVVFAPAAAQLDRLVARDGLSRAEAEARLAAQLPIEEKRDRADFVVDNTGGAGSLAKKASTLVAELRAGAGRKRPGQKARLY
jgi:dephospho-CoA kinase